MSKYDELNDIFCAELKKIFELRDKAFSKAKSVNSAYHKYMELPHDVEFIILNEDLTFNREMEKDFLEKYHSPIQDGQDGYLYFGFLLNFRKNENILTFVKGNYPVILGVKFFEDNSCSIKVKNKNAYMINTTEDLFKFFESLNLEIKNSLSDYLNLSMKSNKKIGF